MLSKMVEQYLWFHDIVSNINQTRSDKLVFKILKQNAYNPEPFNQNDYELNVKKELTKSGPVTALLLLHGYIEAYLIDWLFISGENKKMDIPKQVVEDVQRLGFKRLLEFHFILGNINQATFDKVELFNKTRNEIAHNLGVIDFNHTHNKKEIEKNVLKGITLCKIIFQNYRKTLDKRADSL